MIIVIRTDAPTAEIGLFNNQTALETYSWQAGRALSAQLLPNIEALLQRHDTKWGDVTGLVVFRGPGSFTGLRIGATVANAIAYSRSIPIVGGSGEQWIVGGIAALITGKNDTTVLPQYGAPANVTRPRA